MVRSSTLTNLADIAEDQWGLFTRRQAETTGMAWTTLARLAKDGGATRVAYGVYRLRGAPPADQMGLLVAWLQLAPETPVWERTIDQGVVSHSSAAAIYELGHLAADQHHFTLPDRRQSRRADVHLHRAPVGDGEWSNVGGLLVTRPARIVADLLKTREDAGAVAQVIADSIRTGKEQTAAICRAISPHASKFGLRAADGFALFEWLLDLTGDPDRASWLDEARSSLDRVAEGGQDS
jgi:predicted transcriptional regulator of viral defense system